MVRIASIFMKWWPAANNRALLYPVRALSMSAKGSSAQDSSDGRVNEYAPTIASAHRKVCQEMCFRANASRFGLVWRRSASSRSSANKILLWKLERMRSV
mmetsp:Transcript_8429/g.18103  ORF Transcript_8429/g.18103 Transcript_8429/m.18103 type:complete len:100 (-) Transcript_8429:378-677(-)